MSTLSRLFLVLACLLVTASAQADPPARVGRLALVENGVNFYVDRDDEGGPASINWPISSGARLASERRGRAEIWVGSTAFRLGGNSQLAFPAVDDAEVTLQLTRGTLAVSILDREQSKDVSVLTPEGRIRFMTPGRYRIDVAADHSRLTVQAGAAVFNETQLAGGESGVLYGGERLRVAPDYDRDAFDDWVAERENAALASQARRHVSPAMTGYQDLDAYGTWQTQAEYGAVWYPVGVAADWAPYRFGRWAWVAPWGWTWIDQAPWGFAPFHYGRWVHVHNRWGWVPGSYVARPVYAPALVAWIGNPGWSVSFSFGAAPAVGWFPLAPREVYVPGFRASADYAHRVNHAHIRNLALVDRALRNGPPRPYAYRELPQAVTVVPSSHLREGRPITADGMGRHDRRELERAPQARPVPDNALRPPEGSRPWRGDGRDAGAAPGRDAAAGRSLPGGLNRRDNPTSPGAVAEPPRQERENPRRDFSRRDNAPVRPSDQTAAPRLSGEERAVPRRPAIPDGVGEPRRERRGDDGPVLVPESGRRRPVDQPDRREMPGNRGEAAVPPERPGLPLRPASEGREEGRQQIVPETVRQAPRRASDAGEMPRPERQIARPVDAPRQQEMPVMREERRPAMPSPAAESPVRQREVQRPDFQRPEREMARPAEVPRQREMPVMREERRAPQPQVQPTAPAREAPQGGGNRGERRRERDER